MLLVLGGLVSFLSVGNEVKHKYENFIIVKIFTNVSNNYGIY